MVPITWKEEIIMKRVLFVASTGGHLNEMMQLKELFDKYWDYEANLINPNEISKFSHKKVFIRCIDTHYHGTYEISASVFSKGHRCPYCNESKGEKEIIKFLTKYNIKYKSQYKFKNCKFKRQLPFDFYLPEYNICIEYDGEFHYKMLMDFDNSKIRDSVKNYYCNQNNIKIIRIPYWNFKNIEEILLKEILNK